MTTKPTDLIAIANPSLAKKLADEPKKGKQNNADSAGPSKTDEGFHKSFKQDVWRAVFTLNVIRYVLALFFIGLAVTPTVLPGTQPIDNLIYPDLFLGSTIVLLISAVCFTLFTKTRRFALSQILIAQFAIDMVITSVMVHATGSLTSSFAMLFFLVVTTGSVVLRRIHALALASGAIILIFYEHLYSIFAATIQIQPRYGLMAGYGIILMFSAFTVSYLARRVRAAEMKAYIPSNESIEEYLVRQEVRALKSALASTDGNKTEAAKLLGMTFRSFRYKLTKYDIG